MYKVITIFFLFISYIATAQESYADSMQHFRENYVTTHEVVKGDDRNQLNFFPITEKNRVLARFEAAKETKWITMETSSGSKKTYLIYGYIHFNWNNSACRLTVYQPQQLMLTDEYKNYLFIPFADESNEDSSYTSGRYLDLRTGDIKDNSVLIDFNKAYNPYCAYVSGRYSCPIPQKENFLSVRIDAGEKRFH